MAVVVRVGLRPAPAAVGRQHLEAQRADGEDVARARVPDRDVLIGDRHVQVDLDLRTSPSTARLQDHADRDPCQHAGSPMMWSACGWLATTTSSRFTPTAASSGRDLLLVRSAVDQHVRALRRLIERGIPLSDVEEPDDERRRRADRPSAVDQTTTGNIAISNDDQRAAGAAIVGVTPRERQSRSRRRR